MAFHEIKIGSNSFELAPTYIQNPATASATSSIDDYGFLLFKYDDNEPSISISKLYSPGPCDLPLIKYNSGNLCLEGSILPINNDDGSVGSSDQKFNTMYATTFHGNLSGNATSATDATNATYINVARANNTNASYYIQFVNGTSGNRKSYTDTTLRYNPSTNTLTTTNFAGTATNATYINVAEVARLNITNSSYYIQFVNGTSGNRKSYTDTILKYNPITNTLTATNFAGTATNATYINVAAASTTDASYYIQFVNGTSGNRKSYTDTGLYYNPSTKTLTTTNFAGTATNATYINVAASTTNASYYIQFVNGTSGNKKSYTDTGLYYNPSTNELSAGGGFYERSDERLKDFQEDIEVNFSYLHNIPKKYYSWKDDATYTRHIGTSAQEVQKYYPELVNTDDDGYLTMNYDKLSVVALKAIDVLHEEVTELKKENAELKERLARLEELILNR